MEIANTEMAAAWDGEEGAAWATNADRYEAVGPNLLARFLAAVPIGLDDSVLDVGCGSGHDTRAIARVAGRVLGLDLSSQMLEVARRKAAAEGLTNVTFEQADVQVHPFEPDSFDLAVSSFGAMFFSDPVAAFANVASALKPDGRLALLAWRALSENEWLVSFRGALAMGRELGTPPVDGPTPFSLSDRDRTTSVLTAAGYTDVALEAVDESLYFGANGADAFAFAQTMGIVKGLSHDLNAVDKEKALHKVEQMLIDHETPDGVLFSSAAWLITARKAS